MYSLLFNYYLNISEKKNIKAFLVNVKRMLNLSKVLKKYFAWFCKSNKERNVPSLIFYYIYISENYSRNFTSESVNL